MRSVMLMVLCFGIIAVVAVPIIAQGKEVTLTGKVTCAMCDLKTDKECATVIVVKEGGKDVTYYLDEKSGKANHDAVCKGGKDGSVTGTVAMKGGKNIITASKVDLKK
jgi:hypothetical protein